jgi:hypothetical protein
MTNGFRYQSEQNETRVERGRLILDVHAREVGEDLETCAVDLIADILHALHAEDENLDASAILRRADNTYYGDFEDEEAS